MVPLGPLCSQKFINNSTFGVQKWSKIEKTIFSIKGPVTTIFLGESEKNTLDKILGHFGTLLAPPCKKFKLEKWSFLLIFTGFECFGPLSAAGRPFWALFLGW